MPPSHDGIGDVSLIIAINNYDFNVVVDEAFGTRRVIPIAVDWLLL